MVSQSNHENVLFKPATDALLNSIRGYQPAKQRGETYTEKGREFC